MFAPKFQPGYHRVRLTKVVTLDSGDYLAILSNQHGEVAEYIPEDIRPRTKEERKVAKDRGERLSDWRFWRLVGAFDFPDGTHWETEPRPGRKWDAFADLKEIEARGTECWIETSDWYNNKKQEYQASVEDMRSVARHQLGMNDPGQGGSVAKPEEKVPEEAVPEEAGKELPF